MREHIDLLDEQLHELLDPVVEAIGLEDHLYAKIILGTTVGFIGSVIEKYIGLQPITLLAFLSLLTFESFIKAKADAVIRGIPRTVRALALKMFIYINILFILNALSNSSRLTSVGNVAVNLYDWLFFIIVTWVSFKLIRSILLNLHRLGYSEAEGIEGIIIKELKAFFGVDMKEMTRVIEKDVSINTTSKILILDLEGKIIFAGAELCNILGYTLKEMTNKHYKEFLHPDDVNLSVEIYRTDEIKSFENRWITKDGKYLYVFGWYPDHYSITETRTYATPIIKEKLKYNGTNK